MKRFFHIGYHKTGSTYLQEAVFGESKFFYQLPRMEVQERLLDIGSLEYRADRTLDWYSNHLNQARKAGNACVVISDEELSGNIHTGGNGGYLSSEIAERLHGLDEKAYVLIVVRNQVDIIESAYRQYVKQGGTFGIRRYISGHNGRCHRFPQFRLEHFDYHLLVSYYQELFGHQQIIIIPYEKLVSRLGEFLSDYMGNDVSGVSGMGGLKSSMLHNPSYSFFSVWLSRFTNRFYGEDPINQRVIVNLPYLYSGARKMYSLIDRTPPIRWADTRYRFLTKDLRASIAERYRESNRALMELTDLDLSRLGYPT